VVNEAQSHHFLIADDHPLFRGALREAVAGLFGRAEMAEGVSAQKLKLRMNINRLRNCSVP
jgi:DNA-binding NarL/FixJ family response regulator